MQAKKAWFDEPTNKDPGTSPYPPDQNLADASSEKKSTFEKTDDDDETMEIITVLEGQDIAPFLEDEELLEELLKSLEQVCPGFLEKSDVIDRFCGLCPFDKDAINEPEPGTGQYVHPNPDGDFKSVSMTKNSTVSATLCPNCKTIQPMEYDTQRVCSICKHPIPSYKETHPGAPKPDEPRQGEEGPFVRDYLNMDAEKHTAQVFNKTTVRQINSLLESSGFDGNGRSFNSTASVFDPITKALAENGLKINEQDLQNAYDGVANTLRKMENTPHELAEPTKQMFLTLEDTSGNEIPNTKLAISWYAFTNTGTLEVLAYVTV